MRGVCVACVYSRKMKLCIGGVDFKTKGLAKKYVTETIRKYIGSEINESSDDFAFFMALWMKSPAWVDGATHFEVATKFSGAAIRAVTGDGIKIDFSLRAAIRGKDVNTWTKLTIAMRGAIRPQIQQFKTKCNGKCDMCDKCGYLEIDHIIQFKDLMAGYLDSRSRVFPEVYTYTHSGWIFTQEDLGFEKEWQEWHRSRCSLRPLCSVCHLSVTKAGRSSDSELSASDS